MPTIDNVVVHPLVLLSVVDHYNRVAKDTKKRVVGVLLGETAKGQIDITNSYAVPFEEDPRAPGIWFFDHNYHEEMYAMFKKVNAKEKVVGWYSTGPKIRPSDIDINELMRRYTPEPVLVIIDVNPKDDLEIPTSAYISIENRPEEQSKAERTFSHITCEIGATEAEEVGVEHLLRNIRDTTLSTVSDQVQAKLSSLLSMKKRMEEMVSYLDNVIEGKLPPNHTIIYNIQDILNLSPDLSNGQLLKSLAMTNNDNMMVIYISSLIRSIIALHDLINNKLQNRKWDAEAEKAEEERKDRTDEETLKKTKKEEEKKESEKKE
jgi:26S proteasome regulatory subunit N8